MRYARFPIYSNHLDYCVDDDDGLSCVSGKFLANDWDDEDEEEEEEEEKNDNEGAQLLCRTVLIEGGAAVRNFSCNIRDGNGSVHQSLCVPAIKHPRPVVGAQTDHGASPRHVLEETLNLLTAPSLGKSSTDSLQALCKALDGWQSKVEDAIVKREPKYDDDSDE